ncbi:formate dehydrogenase [Antarcticirhabdus aurantiaca]|uniref:Formate dehydrogenase n=1 Tax=Antarcticirhabdus aurantiaca TaxID=2606717 RepID=A0ACD4NVA5_9HYPH|nr:formate dehydrogenase [Antarcticirhabdus aurantiaca]WAJ30779.1 formate dehydrogenase [Jeongeuplla avenae]
MTSDKRQGLDRRSFLRSAGGVAGVAAAAVAISPSMTVEAEAYDPGEDETRSKYQPDAPDVQAFYRTNGYEALLKG